MSKNEQPSTTTTGNQDEAKNQDLRKEMEELEAKREELARDWMKLEQERMQIEKDLQELHDDKCLQSLSQLSVAENGSQNDQVGEESTENEEQPKSD